MYATRSSTWVFDSTSPQTGMYGCFGFADSPSPWLMMLAKLRNGQVLAHRCQRRHVRRDAPVAALAVALRAGELDEDVRARCNGWIDSFGR